ncbi:unnamed protein product [Phyllotreta striolata]|uniref:Uncharacterized protein n=1 Tax=Phyllotreta striolata TaxID=444603 RepID=A0A9N9XK12_PHYSR|nr:unnamed protein product [Phyllotreta striolata]
MGKWFSDGKAQSDRERTAAGTSFVQRRRGSSPSFHATRNESVMYIKPVNILTIVLLAITSTSSKNAAKSRQKRILWITEDGRLALPPGTTLVIAPSLSLPLVRYPPEGFFSNMTISLPFTIDFNKLGLTDNENPYGVLPPLLARSMGRAAGSALADYISSMLERRRSRRSTGKPAKEPEPLPHAFHGGERALLYVMLEELLEQFGMDGKACLLRAICEVHAYPMRNFGLLGEMLKLFFSASKSPYADKLNEYVEAEYSGSGRQGGLGECWPYMKDCPKSLFLNRHNYYTDSDDDATETEENEVEQTKDEKYSSKATLNLPLRGM